MYKEVFLLGGRVLGCRWLMEHSFLFAEGEWFCWPNSDLICFLLVVDLVVVCQKDGGM